jgi:hypothetical protein
VLPDGLRLELIDLHVDVPALREADFLWSARGESSAIVPPREAALAVRAPRAGTLHRHARAVETQLLVERGNAGGRGGMGVNVDHTKVFRFAKAHQVELNQLLKGIRMQNPRNANVPSAAEYVGALEALTISDVHRKMLGAHYFAHNRSITYTKLAEAAGKSSHVFANKAYGDLGKMLGERLNFNFIWAEHRNAPFYSSAIGMDNPYVPPRQHYELVMHHELAKALDALGWYRKLVEAS